MAASRPHLDHWRPEKEVEERRSKFRGAHSTYIHSSDLTRGRSRENHRPSRHWPSPPSRPQREVFAQGSTPTSSPRRTNSRARYHRNLSRESRQSSYERISRRYHLSCDETAKRRRRSLSGARSPQRRELVGRAFSPRLPPSGSIDHYSGTTSASRRRSPDSHLSSSVRREPSPALSSYRPSSVRRRTPSPSPRSRRQARPSSFERARKSHRSARESLSPKDHNSRYICAREGGNPRRAPTSLERYTPHKGTPTLRDASASPRHIQAQRRLSIDRHSHYSNKEMPPLGGSYRGGRGARSREYDSRPPPHYRNSRAQHFGYPEADSRSYGYSSRQSSPFDDSRGPYSHAARDDHPSRSFARGGTPPSRAQETRPSFDSERGRPAHSSYDTDLPASARAPADERGAEVHDSSASLRGATQASGRGSNDDLMAEADEKSNSNPTKKPEGETKLRFSLKGKTGPASSSEAAARNRKALVFDDSKPVSQAESSRALEVPDGPKAELGSRSGPPTGPSKRSAFDADLDSRSQGPPRGGPRRPGVLPAEPHNDFLDDVRHRPPPGPRRREPEPYRDWPRGPPSSARDYDRGPPPSVREYDRGPPPIREYDGDAPPLRGYDRGPPPPSRDYGRGPPLGPRDYDRGPPSGVRDYERDAPPPARDYGRRLPPDPRDYDRGPPLGPRDYGRVPPSSREFAREPPHGPRGYHYGPSHRDPYDPYYRDDPYYDDPYARQPYPRERPREHLPSRRGPPQKPVSTQAPAPAPTPPRKTIKRLKPKRTLPPELVSSESVYFRKPGNESVVGSGTYGKVFKAVHVYTGVKVALKKIRMEGERDGFPVTAIREVKLLQSLNHPNVVTLQEVMVERNDCYMVFEYLSHDLTGLLNHPTFKLTQSHKKYLAKQLFEGLDYLHRRGVLHRDIKAANILVSNTGQLKLADFGLARFFAKRRQLDYTNRVITIWYRSPELLLGETRYDATVDIWSAACVLVEIFTRHAIFPGDGGEISQLDKIHNVLGTPTRQDWPGLAGTPWYEILRPSQRLPSTFEEKYAQRVPTKAAFELLRDMFVYDPSKRPDAAQVLAHPYFTEEEPRPESVTQIEGLEGEWHEFESKALRREKDRAEREARRAKDAAASGLGIDQAGGTDAEAQKDERERMEKEKRKRERARQAEDNEGMGVSVAELFGEDDGGREGKRQRIDASC